MKKTLLSLCLLASLAGAAQKVSGKLALQKGQTIEVTTNSNVTTQMAMGEIPMTIVTTELYTVGETGDGKIQLTKSMKRMKVNASMMGQEMNMDSDNPKDLEGQFGGPIKEVMKQKQEFTVDAAGTVIAVKDNGKKAKAEEGGMGGMMMPGLSAGAGALAIGQASFFKALPVTEMGKGDAWTDSTSGEAASSKTVYTVKDITPTEILLDYTGQTKTKGKQNAMGMSVDMEASGKVSGTVTVDRATGLIKQKTLNSDTDTSMNLGGNDMSSTTKVTATTTVKTL